MQVLQKLRAGQAFGMTRQKASSLARLSEFCPRSHTRMADCVKPNFLSNSVLPSISANRRTTSVARAESTGTQLTTDDVVRVATVGDIVTIHYTCKGTDGQVLDSSRESEEGEPISFEVGAGDVMGNKLFQGFDEAVRGLAVGQGTVLEATGGEWQQELLFAVPRDHPEIERLEGRYKNHGGLKEGMIVELANQQLAVIVGLKDDAVQIDANNMMAGKVLVFELELVGLEKPGEGSNVKREAQEELEGAAA